MTFFSKFRYFAKNSFFYSIRTFCSELRLFFSEFRIFVQDSYFFLRFPTSDFFRRISTFYSEIWLFLRIPTFGSEFRNFSQNAGFSHNSIFSPSQFCPSNSSQKSWKWDTLYYLINISRYSPFAAAPGRNSRRNCSRWGSYRSRWCPCTRSAFRHRRRSSISRIWNSPSSWGTSSWSGGGACV